MKNKIVGMVVLMLVATSVVSATDIIIKEPENNNGNPQPLPPSLFDWWNVDQKQTHTDNYGVTLTPPDTQAQSFTPAKDKLTAVSLYLFKHGTPPEPVHITVSIRDNLTGSDLATHTIDTSVVTIGSKHKWVLFDFEDISVTPSNKYYIICSGDAGDATENAYCWLYSANDTYTQGDAYYKENNVSSWNKWINGVVGDFCFKTYFRKPLDVSSAPINNDKMRMLANEAPHASMTGGWMEGQKILASDGDVGDYFGGTIAISGDTALITSPYDDDNGADSGSTYVFTRSGTTWTQQAKLNASDGAAGDYFGWYASLDGDTAIIGALLDDDNGTDSGSAYVFIRTGTTWTQQAKLLASDGAKGDHFGYFVTLEGNTTFVCANHDNNENGNLSGSVYVFTRTGTTWTQQQKLLASDGQAGDRFGGTTSVSGDTLLIGTYEDDDNGVDSGSAYIFTRNGTTWTQQQKLLASDGAAGDWFGTFTSLDDDTAIIGAPYHDDNGADSGSAYVFTRSGTTWTQQAKLNASDGAAGDQFSYYGIALDGDTALIGSWQDDDKGTNSGSAYVFTRTGTTWTQQQKLLASDGEAGDEFGFFIVLDGNTALLGADSDNDNGANSGSVYVFTKTDLTFSISGGLGVNLKITNNGPVNVSDVPWQIHVEGGILGMINKTVNGTIDIPAGGSIAVRAVSLGFGAISIIANVAGEEQTAEGMQIIIFSIVK